MSEDKKNTGEYNSGDCNSGYCNSGDRNSGNYNSGDYNSGYYNSGDCNSGNYSSGDRNSGNYNSGHHNSGNYNSGDYNSGDYNSGYYNSGDCNSGNYSSGHRNSGNYNSGHHNSGEYNSGNYNSGNCNSGNCNSGFFNTDEPNIRLFNKETSLKRKDVDIPYIKLKTIEWISETYMNTEQKKNDPDFHVRGGTLIIRSYKDAWALYWNEAPETDKKRFKDLPNFCPKIFEEITGIDVNAERKVKIEVEGKTILLSRESALTLGLIKE